MYLAFSLGENGGQAAIPGLIAMASFFGAGAIQAVSLPLERKTKTINMLLTAPTSLSTIVSGKVLAGFLFGALLSFTYAGIVALFFPITNFPLLIVAILISSLLFSAFGLFLSAPFRDIPDAMPPATVIRIAMVFICGVFTPLETLHTALRTTARFLPLTYSVDAIRQAMTTGINTQPFSINLIVQLIFLVFFVWTTIEILKRKIG